MNGEVVRVPQSGPFAPRLSCMSRKKFVDSAKVCQRNSDCQGRCMARVGPSDEAVYPGQCADREMFFNVEY